MPNGKIFRPYRLPGMYCCYMCRELKDAEEFYKDCTRWNGCGSRCKKCDNYRSELRKDGKTPTSAAANKRTSVDNRWSKRQVKKRIEEIKALFEPEKVKGAYEKVGMVRPWTDGEDAKLQQMLKAGDSMETIAKTLHRGKGAIRTRIPVVGYLLDSERQRKWTAEEQLEFEGMIRVGASDDDIAIKLKRSLSAVQSHRRKLEKEKEKDGK